VAEKKKRLGFGAVLNYGEFCRFSISFSHGEGLAGRKVARRAGGSGFVGSKGPHGVWSAGFTGLTVLRHPWNPPTAGGTARHDFNATDSIPLSVFFFAWGGFRHRRCSTMARPGYFANEHSTRRPYMTFTLLTCAGATEGARIPRW